jgi:catechol 2,3-dioxygenase-like lactoylglutathione lyase family enzyme
MTSLNTPARHHHLAYVTYDSEATVDFYTRVMKMPLVNAVMDDKIPSTGEPFPYIHIFFRMGDGATLAFFEVPGIPRLPLFADHPVHQSLNHIALEVDGLEELEAWYQWLRQCGVDVIRTDHGIIESLYFRDPNGIRLELTRTVDKSWNDKAESATGAMARWARVKGDALRAGGDGVAELCDLARAESHARQVRTERAA